MNETLMKTTNIISEETLVAKEDESKFGLQVIVNVSLKLMLLFEKSKVNLYLLITSLPNRDSNLNICVSI